MNNITWNGVDSRTLSGLLICELPPITKPAQRVQITEIEGKDGDITDKIGYQAYDKIVQIGLIKDFDVDKIAKYFTGSGEVIFSNEPDKYYIAQILEQINFERLVQFKTATVKFHTQPFKYLVGEPSVEAEITTQTEIIVTNQGLENSRSIMTLEGTGIIEIAVNGLAVFQVDLDDGSQPITVNSEIEECYAGSPLVLMNRSMVGIFPLLVPGKNIITWTGALTNIIIQPRSRWL